MNLEHVAKINGKVVKLRTATTNILYTENGPVFLGPKLNGVRFGTTVVRGEKARFARQIVTVD